MRPRILAVAGAGMALVASLGMAPIVLAETVQVPFAICEPTSSSYAVSTTNTITNSPVQTVTDTVTDALGLRLENEQGTAAISGSSAAISACEQLARAEQQS
jgi:hypothetical protein